MRSFTLTVLGVALFAGCTGRSLSVRDAREGDVSLVRNREFEKVYFVPFSMAGVALEGAHSEGDKAKWFVHVAAGAQLEMKKRMRGSQVVIVGTGPSDHGRKVMDKLGVRLEWAQAVPKGALRVSGRYVSSREVSGTGRFFFSGMAGKSWTRASVAIRVGEGRVFDCVVDGKYLGSEWSWGYETLGANEALGAGVIEVLSTLQKGKKVESE